LIRNSLERTKKSTFVVRVPSTKPEYKGFPLPNGTGFFISADGYFLTANHVIKGASKLTLSQPELQLSMQDLCFLGHIDIVQIWSQFDIALLKVNIDKNINNPLLVNKKGFDYLDIDFEDCLDGTPVYSYGFPLPDVQIKDSGPMLVGIEYLCPRVTSAIIASHYDAIGPEFSQSLPKYYVIDKALNYGNSGGPIIRSDSGKVIALCCRFQPVSIPQVTKIRITIPALYSIASSLANIEREIKKLVKETN
jgi:serine protease Do